VRIPTGDAHGDAKNGCFAPFCTSAPMHTDAFGADGATRNVLYKNPESIIEIVTAIKHVARHKTRYTINHGNNAMHYQVTKKCTLQSLMHQQSASF
jgi:hypothetical protein